MPHKNPAKHVAYHEAALLAIDELTRRLNHDPKKLPHHVLHKMIEMGRDAPDEIKINFDEEVSPLEALSKMPPDKAIKLLRFETEQLRELLASYELHLARMEAEWNAAVTAAETGTTENKQAAPTAA